jgi:pyruvate-ferredoxin/flavodoxin oxidoreductase
MPDWLAGSARWLRRLLGSAEARSSTDTEPPFLGSGAQALLALEARQCDAVWHPQMSATAALHDTHGVAVAFRRVQSSRSALAAAEGMALTGARVAVFLPNGELPAIETALRGAVERRVPLVVHLAISSSKDHAALHLLAQAGALVFVPRDAQHALDLTLAARRAAELTLCPAVVAVDGPEIDRAVHRLQLLSVTALDELMGSPDDLVPASTPAEALLVGEQRRRVPRGMDMNRPVLRGAAYVGADEVGALGSRQRCIEVPGPALADKAFEDVAAAVHRRLGHVVLHRVDDARHVIVALGVAARAAEAVADHLRSTTRLRVGVVGIASLHPFPSSDLAQALQSAERVLVLEQGSAPPGPQAPLAALVAAIVGPGRLTSTTCAAGPIPASRLTALCEQWAKGGAPRAVNLDVAPLGSHSQFPKRQAYLDAVHRTHPDLNTGLAPWRRPLDLRPTGARTVAVHAPATHLSSDGLEALVTALEEPVGEHSHVRVDSPSPGTALAWITAAPQPIVSVGDASEADVLVLPSLTLPEWEAPVRHARNEAAVLIGSDLDGAALWARLPAAWQATVAERELRVFVANAPFEALATTAAALAAAGTCDGAVEVDWRALHDDVPSPDTPVPLAVRRFGSGDGAHDTVQRFWGELGQPRLAGEQNAAAPDPHLATGTIPAATASFHASMRGRVAVPVLDPTRCIGCGTCWTACSDAAIAPVALGLEALLDAAEERASGPGIERSAAASKIKRAHKPIASRAEGILAKSDRGLLCEDTLRDAFSWWADKSGADGAERLELERSFTDTVAQACRVPMVVTKDLFRDPHGASKGTGKLLVMTFDTRSCQGCGVCEAVCTEDALHLEAPSPARLGFLDEQWRIWESLPDTPGACIAEAARHPDVGPMSAALLSRHCAMTVTGGDGAEPGSGARLATRLVTTATEHTAQLAVTAHVRELGASIAALEEAVRSTLATALPSASAERVGGALEGVPLLPGNLPDLLARMEARGDRATVDTRRLALLVEATDALTRLRGELTYGALGTGRARFAVVVADPETRAWAGTFPRNPFSVPVVAADAPSGADLATGLLEGLTHQRVMEARSMRRAALLLQNPADVPLRLRELDHLGWEDLSEEERALCPPVLLLAGTSMLSDAGMAGLSRVLSSGLPAKVVLLDGRELDATHPDPTLFALQHREAFLLAASIAHPVHLFEGVASALSYSGPAFIHVHAPSPRAHGFEPRATVDRARAAVDSRVHPLLRSDPRREGVFGSRIDLTANPSPTTDWHTDEAGRPLTPAEFAGGESRFADLGGGALDRAVAHRLSNWRTLQELAGVSTPFTQAVRARVEQELSEAHAQDLAGLRADHEAQVHALRQQQAAEQADRLRQRLLQLAGYDALHRRPSGGNGA